MDLEDLGWNEHFQAQVDELGTEGFVTGRISRVDVNSFEVLTEKGEMESRLAGRLRKSNSVPGVGDWVLIKPMETGNMIFFVLDRTSKISRKTPGRESSEQLVAANINIIFILMGLDDDYNPRRIERYLAMVSNSGADPVIILNKEDVADDPKQKYIEISKINPRVPVHMISALNDEGLEIIRGYLETGATIALVGSSGVGKSTLINALSHEELQKTGSTRKKDSKGRHITTSRELIMIEGGGMIIDNPGIREIQLWGDEASLDGAFPDITEIALTCKFKDCQHEKEPDCGVKKAVEDGRLDGSRFNNFIKMKRELQYLEIRSSKSSEAAEREKWKPIMKGMKKYYKYKKTRD